MKQGISSDNTVELGRSNLRFKKFHLSEWGTPPSGTILQVKQHYIHTVTSIASGSAANITTQAITPTSSSSKFLLIANTSFGYTSGTPNVRGWFRRGGTDLGTFSDGARKGAIVAAEIRNGSEDIKNMGWAWLDSPNTTNP